MTNYREILRLYALGISKQSIAKTMGISRNTVVKVIEHANQAKLIGAVGGSVSDEELQASLFPNRAETQARKKPDFETIHKELAKSGVTLSLLWHEYCLESKRQNEIPLMYSRFCENYREFAQTKKATMHIHRKPGEVIEVDWAGTTLPIIDSLSGEVSEASIFVGVLPSSQYGYVEAFLSRNEEAWISAHNHMYHYFGGVSKLLVPDNLKTGVLKHTSEEVVLNKTYQEMAEHYGTVILPARVRAPKDKPSVEMSVNVITTWIIASLRNTRFFRLSEVNEAIQEKTEEYNTKPFQKKEGSRRSVFLEEEKAFLLPLPSDVYELSTWKVATVQFNYCIDVDKMHYSVPYEYIRQRVEVRSTERVIEVFYNALRIASHPKLQGKPGQYSILKEHMPADHQKYIEWDGDRFRQWATKIGPHTATVIEVLLTRTAIEQQGYKSAMALLKLADKHSIQRLENACKRALSYTPAPSYQNVKRILLSGQDKEIITTEEHEPANPYGFVRGNAYYGGKK